MSGRILMCVLVLASVGGCAGTPSADQRNATDLNPSGRPYVGPATTRNTVPPGDINTFNPLDCHPQGLGSVCDREPSASSPS